MFSVFLVKKRITKERMKTKFKEALLAKSKDMGLSDKAIDDLVELGVNGLGDDATDADIAAKVDSLLPFAKLMQAEVTRKTSKKAKPKDAPSGEDTGKDVRDEGGKGGADNEVLTLLKQMQTKLTSMEEENARMKAEKQAETRKAQIKAKAKELGIPDVMMQRFAIGDDEDIEKTLTEYKQSLVNASLMPKSQAHEVGNTTLKEMTDAEDAFVRGLPDRQAGSSIN